MLQRAVSAVGGGGGATRYITLTAEQQTAVLNANDSNPVTIAEGDFSDVIALCPTYIKFNSTAAAHKELTMSSPTQQTGYLQGSMYGGTGTISGTFYSSRRFYRIYPDKIDIIRGEIVTGSTVTTYGNAAVPVSISLIATDYSP